MYVYINSFPNNNNHNKLFTRNSEINNAKTDIIKPIEIF